jgi:hypothetical protein
VKWFIGFRWCRILDHHLPTDLFFRWRFFFRLIYFLDGDSSSVEDLFKIISLSKSHPKPYYFLLHKALECQKPLLAIVASSLENASLTGIVLFERNIYMSMETLFFVILLWHLIDILWSFSFRVSHFFLWLSRMCLSVVARCLSPWAMDSLAAECHGPRGNHSWKREKWLLLIVVVDLLSSFFIFGLLSRFSTWCLSCFCIFSTSFYLIPLPLSSFVSFSHR